MRPIDADAYGEKLYKMMPEIDEENGETCMRRQMTYFCLAVLNDMPTIATPPNDPLTLEQLREMGGEPVWCEDYQLWGIVKIESEGQWANQPFLFGAYHSDGIATNFEYNIEKRGLTLYRRKPEALDGEAAPVLSRPEGGPREVPI